MININFNLIARSLVHLVTWQPTYWTRSSLSSVLIHFLPKADKQHKLNLFYRTKKHLTFIRNTKILKIADVYLFSLQRGVIIRRSNYFELINHLQTWKARNHSSSKSVFDTLTYTSRKLLLLSDKDSSFLNLDLLLSSYKYRSFRRLSIIKS